MYQHALAPRVIRSYDAAMPKGPLIENRGIREWVLAALMGLMLLGSLGLAWLITGAALGR